jgi:ribosomal protein L19E
MSSLFIQGLLCRDINTQQEVIELMEASAVDLKKTVLAQNKFIAARHGRKHTGRRRGRPKKLIGSNGQRIVPTKAVDSEEEEEEE